MKKRLSREQAFKEAIETLQAFKGLVSELNAFVADYALLETENIDASITAAFPVDPTKKLTSILQISCECDEQIGLLQEASTDEQKEST